MPATDVTTIASTHPFTIAQRCDRCGARATVRAVMSNGGELLFCGHHAREHEGRLHELAVTLQLVN